MEAAGAQKMPAAYGTERSLTLCLSKRPGAQTRRPDEPNNPTYYYGTTTAEDVNQDVNRRCDLETLGCAPAHVA